MRSDRRGNEGRSVRRKIGIGRGGIEKGGRGGYPAESRAHRGPGSSPQWPIPVQDKVERLGTGLIKGAVVEGIEEGVVWRSS